MDRKNEPSNKSWRLRSGACLSGDRVMFRVWAPSVASMSIIIKGGPNEIAMARDREGYFVASCDHLPVGTNYFYLLNGEKQRPDPVSRYQPEGVHGPSEVIDPGSFNWEDQDWRGLSLEKLILYEIHTGTFTPEGTFEAILPLLDYLKHDLGVTAIELMPVSQFPGERNWGYDGACLYAPQNSYGGPSGLKKLVNACHGKGLAVLLDVVYNHLGPEGNYLADYGPYFTDRYKTPWGSAVNFDGPRSDDVRRFFIDNALYWVTEYHVDGLRIDAVHGIFDLSARHILFDIREALRRQSKSLGRTILVFAESDLNDVRIINPPRKGGYGLDAQWNDDFHHSLHTLLTGERAGYYQDFGDIRQIVKAMKEGFVYSGQYSRFRERCHGSSTKHLPASTFVIFSQNHDQVGNRVKGYRLTTLVPFEALKLAAAIILLSPGIPLLFMGEEYGEKAPFYYFISHGDEGLINAVRTGRREEFSAFQWEGEIPDPQDPATFLNSKINLLLRHQESHATLFEFYRALIRLRKEIPVLSHPDRKKLKIKRFGKKRALFVQRERDSDRIVCLLNFDGFPAVVKTQMEPGHWQKLMDSASEEWGGKRETAPPFFRSDGTEVSFQLAPYSLLLFVQNRSKTGLHAEPS